MTDTPGDPACWLGEVCAECGAIVGATRASLLRELFARTGGEPALRAVGLRVGRGIQPMLASPAAHVCAALDGCTSALVELEARRTAFRAATRYREDKGRDRRRRHRCAPGAAPRR